ncbi:MAG: DUF1761 domain-containing protein [Bacteroidota bacterium]
MMQPNLAVMALTALVPLITGFIWYNNKTFGTTWMRINGFTPESMKGGNMLVMFGLTFLLSFFLTMPLYVLTIHQFSFQSVFQGHEGFNTEGSDIQLYISEFLAKNGSFFRTFKHGMLHGFMAGLMIATPVVGINAIFERRGFKYVAIHAGYWIVTLMIMGGIICQFG